MKLKAFVFTDDLFCWGMVVLAETEEQARDLAREPDGYNPTTSAGKVEVKELTLGVLMEAGGNA